MSFPIILSVSGLFFDSTRFIAALVLALLAAVWANYCRNSIILERGILEERVLWLVKWKVHARDAFIDFGNDHGIHAILISRKSDGVRVGVISQINFSDERLNVLIASLEAEGAAFSAAFVE
jgi:hypothetical protein